MSRRGIFAGLGALVLAVLLVAALLFRSGESGTEPTRGTPVTGRGAVTRDVGWIRSRQRYLDRHPEIERRQGRRDAALEAAQEEALREQGGESEAEGQPPTEEGQADGQASSHTGSHTGTIRQVW